MLGYLTGGLPLWACGVLFLYGLMTVALLVTRAAGAELAMRSGVAALALLAWFGEPVMAPLVAVAAITLLTGMGILLGDARRGMAGLIREREEVARQLDRRIHELFTMQELSYVLSESLQPDRILDQVVRYAQRFLQAEGALVALLQEDTGDLRIVSAEGPLETLRGRTMDIGESRLMEDAIRRGRIESATDTGHGVELLPGVPIRSAAAIPLRAHGETMGILAVTDRKTGTFTLHDLQLLSTVATQAAVVLANSRFFALVHRAKEEWETTFDALNEGIVVVNAEGRVSRANHALGRLLRVETRSLIDHLFTETAIGATEAARDLLRSARSGERTAPVLTRLEDLRLVLRLTAAPIPDSTWESSVVLLIEDVTEQRKLESQLIHNEKMATVGQLVSGVAHELNNPLTSIIGLAEFLLERVPEGDPNHEHLDVIHHQASRAGRIVRNLLTFARQGSTEKTRIDLNELLIRTCELCQNDMHMRQITLERELSPAETLTLADPYELQQVLLNLVTNAAHALNERRAGSGRIRLTAALEGDRARLRVEDNGPGVPAELQAKLFTPFFTTKEPGQGTGLGLSISYGIIEANGGHLSFSPSPMGGASFTITLPALPPDTAPRARRSNGSPRRILVLDTDAAIRDAVTDLFEAQGHRVEGMSDTQSALEYLQEHPHDLIIADTAACGGDGVPFHALLARRLPAQAGRLLLVGDAPDPGSTPVTILPKPLNMRSLRHAADQILRA